MRPLILIVVAICCLTQDITEDHKVEAVQEQVVKSDVEQEQLEQIADLNISPEQEQQTQAISTETKEDSIPERPNNAETQTIVEVADAVASIDQEIDQQDLQEEVEIQAEELQQENILDQTPQQNDEGQDQTENQGNQESLNQNDLEGQQNQNNEHSTQIEQNQIEQQTNDDSTSNSDNGQINKEKEVIQEQELNNENQSSQLENHNDHGHIDNHEKPDHDHDHQEHDHHEQRHAQEHEHENEHVQDHEHNHENENEHQHQHQHQHQHEHEHEQEHEHQVKEDQDTYHQDDHHHDHSDHDHDHNHNQDHNHNHNHDHKDQDNHKHHDHHDHDHHDHDHDHHHHQKQSITLEESPVLNLEFDLYEQPYFPIWPNWSLLFNNKLWNEQLIALLPINKQDQLIYSLILTQLPSLPIFIILLLTIKGSKNLQRKSIVSNMISFSFGSMLGDVFFHMIPSISETHDHHHHGHDHGHDHSVPCSTLYILAGIIGFIIIDFLVIKIKSRSNKVEDQHEHDHGSDSAVLFLFSDFLHNFTDGIAIGATFAVNIKSGISTTLAILFHEIPHEIGDFAYLLKRKHSMFKILLTQIITSAGCFLGAYFSYQFRNYSTQLVAFTCGSFIFVAFDSILPEMKSSFKIKPSCSRLTQNLISIGLGLYTMHVVGQLE